MNKLLFCILSGACIVSAYARDFSYNNLNYTVLDENAKTCETKQGFWGVAGNTASGDLVIPETVSDGTDNFTVVQTGAFSFYNCVGLKSVKLPNTILNIAPGSFGYCEDLVSVEIPESVVTIEDAAFSDCSALYSINFPNSLTKIGERAFFWCTSLKNVELPESLTTLGQIAFQGCSALENITIPASITEFGFGIFSGCENIKEVYYSAENPVSGSEQMFESTTYEQATLYIRESALEIARNTKPWSLFANIKIHDFNVGIAQDKIDFNEDIMVYSINGTYISDNLNNLQSGIYIIRQGSKFQKVII